MPTEGPKSSSFGLRVEEGGSVGRRKMLQGKEAATTVQFEEIISATTAVSEKDVSYRAAYFHIC